MKPSPILNAVAFAFFNPQVTLAQALELYRPRKKRRQQKRRGSGGGR